MNNIYHGFFVILLFLLTGKSLSQTCEQDASITGHDFKSAGITQYTVEYANAPSRWASAQLNDLLPGTQAVAKTQKCAQFQCLACGWKPTEKIDPNDKITMVVGQERCHYLSVFTPHVLEKTAPFPVVFHVHHGQFLYGFKTELGEVQKVVEKGIAVSNANFRVGLMGFFSHPDVQVNAGQQDLILALKWVQNNICKLGGNRNQVTVSGSSSGASQVLMLLASKSATGLFHGAWVVSATSYGNPDFFSKDVNFLYENEIKNSMAQIGCGTLDCMKELDYKQLLVRMMDANSPLVVLTPEAIKDLPKRTFFAYDGTVVPNMHETACFQTMANQNVPVVTGHAKDELDTLKFQFPVVNLLKNLVEAGTKDTKFAANAKCLQSKLLKTQGSQETAEDVMFGLPAYIAATRTKGRNVGPRWHFLINAPTSVSHRAWHTTAELLSWGPLIEEDTLQYHHVTKRFVLGNADEELRRYSHSNFLHFIKNNKVQDERWVQTTPTPLGEISGVPSKLWDQGPLRGRITYEQHHTNTTISGLYGMLCSRHSGLSKKNSEFQNCEGWTHNQWDELKSTLGVTKASDMEFAKSFADSMPNMIRDMMEQADKVR